MYQLAGRPMDKSSLNDPRRGILADQFEDERVRLPVTVEDFLNQRNLQGKIYANNRAGKPITLVGTSQDPDNSNEDEGNPTNYPMEIKLDLNAGDFTNFIVHDKVIVQYWYVNGAGQKICSPAFTVDGPNNKSIVFKIRDGKLMENVTQNSGSPNSLQLINSASGIDLRVAVYKSVYSSATNSQHPIRTYTLPYGETAEYVHKKKYVMWVFDRFSETKAVSLSSSTLGVARTTIAGEAAKSSMFRVGDSTYYTYIADVESGHYLTVVLNGMQTPIVDIINVDTLMSGLKLIPSNKYGQNLC